MPRTINLTHNVRPRYTPGSPACVSARIAERVAHEERTAHEVALTGAYGPEEQANARALGLSNIVTAKTERRGGWDVLDLLTDERYRRPFKWKAGQRVERWDADEGWVTCVVHEKSDGVIVKVREAEMPWTRPPWEERRDDLRLA